VDVVIRLERTACFGACPAYVVALSGDGRVTFDPGHFADDMMSFQSIEPQAFFELLEDFYERRFFTLADEYTELPTIMMDEPGRVTAGATFVTDLPSTILTVTVGDDYEKAVHAYWAYPDVIDELAATVEATGGITNTVER
jgi:hypothetical protein